MGEGDTNVVQKRDDTAQFDSINLRVFPVIVVPGVMGTRLTLKGINWDPDDREEAIRSKKPDGVRQELWGILLAYNLVRLEMEALATQEKIEPTRISFIESLRLIRNEWDWLSVTSPGAIPKRLATLRQNVKRYILPPRRRRSYPRAVKIKVSNYAHNTRRPERLK